MTADELGFLEWAFKGLVALIFTVGGWLWTSLIRTVKDLKESLMQLTKEFNDHKLKISEDYVSKTDFKQEVNRLSEHAIRIESKVDSMPERLAEIFRRRQT